MMSRRTSKLEFFLFNIYMKDTFRRVTGGGAVAGVERGGVSAELLPSKPAVAGTRGTWTVRLHTRRRSIDKGGAVAVMLAEYGAWGQTAFQVEHPTQEGFVSVASSCRGTRFRLSAGNDPQAAIVCATVARHRIETGSTVEVQLGARQDGGPGWRAPYRSVERYRFLVAIDWDGSGRFYRLPNLLSRQVVPQKPGPLYVRASSTPRRGGALRVAVTCLDRWALGDQYASSPFTANQAVDYKGTVEIRVPGATRAGILRHTFCPKDAGSHTFEVSPPKSNTPVRVEVVDSERCVRATSNPVWTGFLDDGNQIFFGDIHGHCMYSDAIGTPEEYFAYGRDVEGFDFCALTDHVEHLYPAVNPEGVARWRRIVDVVRRFDEPGRYATLLGFEWTDWNRYGNHNVYYRDADGPFIGAWDHTFFDASDGKRASRYNCRTLEELCARLVSHDAIIVPHHFNVLGNWSNRAYRDYPQLFPVAEIVSHWGVSEKHKANPAGTTVREAIRAGLRFGFIGGTDNHLGRAGADHGSFWGLAAVIAPRLTRKSVFDALKHRRCYATTRARILLDVRIGCLRMGEQGTVRDPVEVSVKAVGTAPILAVDIVRDGLDVYSTVIRKGQGQVDLTWKDKTRLEGWHSYYVRVTQEDGEKAWSSPIWVRCSTTRAQGLLPVNETASATRRPRLPHTCLFYDAFASPVLDAEVWDMEESFDSWSTRSGALVAGKLASRRCFISENWHLRLDAAFFGSDEKYLRDWPSMPWISKHQVIRVFGTSGNELSIVRRRNLVLEAGGGTQPLEILPKIDASVHRLDVELCCGTLSVFADGHLVGRRLSRIKPGYVWWIEVQAPSADVPVRVRRVRVDAV